MLMDRLLKVATLFTAATVCVPLSVPEVGFVPMATVTLAVLEVRLPPESSIRTVTAGEMEAAAVVLEGWTPNFSLAGGPTEGVREKSAVVVAPWPLRLQFVGPPVWKPEAVTETVPLIPPDPAHWTAAE